MEFYRYNSKKLKKTHGYNKSSHKKFLLREHLIEKKPKFLNNFL